VDTPQVHHCPACQSTDVKAVRVGTAGPGRLVVDYVCSACGHQWTVKRDSETLFRKP
jgi:transposase-like protein